MSQYDQNKTAHRVLKILAEGEARTDQLRDIIGQSGPQRRKLWYVLYALAEDGLIRKGNSYYFLTPQGGDALEDLNAGMSVCLPGLGPNRTVEKAA